MKSDRIHVVCPCCRTKQRVFALEAKRRNTLCPVCLEEKECLILHCHDNHQLCLSCLEQMNVIKVSRRELVCAKKIPRYVYCFLQEEYIPDNHYTVYQDRGMNIWVLLQKEEPDFYSLEGGSQKQLEQLVQDLEKRYRFWPNSQGYWINRYLPEKYQVFTKAISPYGLYTREHFQYWDSLLYSSAVNSSLFNYTNHRHLQVF